MQSLWIVLTCINQKQCCFNKYVSTLFSALCKHMLIEIKSIDNHIYTDDLNIIHTIVIKFEYLLLNSSYMDYIQHVLHLCALMTVVIKGSFIISKDITC